MRRQDKYVTSIERMAEERGIEEGREEGREEERRSLALKMLHENIPLEAIIRITGLSIAQLQQLQADQAQ